MLCNSIPTLVAVDEVNSFFRPTQYLSQDGKELDPEHLKLAKLFLNYISGKSTFKHGAIVAATSDTLLANKSEVLDVTLGVKEVSPYKRLSQTILPWTQGLTSVEVPNYTREEAKGVFDYYKKANIFFDGMSSISFLLFHIVLLLLLKLLIGDFLYLINQWCLFSLVFLCYSCIRTTFPQQVHHLERQPP